MNKEAKYSFEDSIGKLARQSAAAIGSLISKNFQEKGLKYTSKDWMYLSFIKNSENISQKELAKLLGYNKVMINRGLEKLESQDLIIRKVDSIDNRMKRLSLNPIGEDLYQNMKTIVENSMQSIYQNIEEKEKQTCIHVLERILSNID